MTCCLCIWSTLCAVYSMMSGHTEHSRHIPDQSRPISSSHCFQSFAFETLFAQLDVRLTNKTTQYPKPRKQRKHQISKPQSTGIMKPFHSEFDAILENLLIRHTRPSVAVVGQIEMSHGALFGEHHKTNDTTGATVPFDCLLQSAPHKVDTLLLRHLLPPVGVGITVDVGRPRTTDGE